MRIEHELPSVSADRRLTQRCGQPDLPGRLAIAEEGDRLDLRYAQGQYGSTFETRGAIARPMRSTSSSGLHDPASTRGTSGSSWRWSRRWSIEWRQVGSAVRTWWERLSISLPARSLVNPPSRRWRRRPIIAVRGNPCFGIAAWLLGGARLACVVPDVICLIYVARRQRSLYRSRLASRSLPLAGGLLALLQ